MFPISQLWRYPVKGLSGQPLVSADLSAGTHFPGDRKYAIGAGNEKVDDGLWLKKAFFLQLMSHEALAGIDCDFDMDQTREMIILSRDDKQLLSANMQSDAGRRLLPRFLMAFSMGNCRAGKNGLSQ